MRQEQLPAAHALLKDALKVLPSDALKIIPLRLRHLAVRVPAIKSMELKESASDPG